MFRAAATGPYDDTVAKATDENLTAEDWATIIDICDRVTSDSNGPKDVVQSLIRRLAHRNANVQLYTLELANALTQNCSKPMHRELASRSFTDALLKLASDRNTHSQVKSKIIERMKDWTEMFKDDGDLGIMREAFARVKQSNPNIQPPSAPQKNNLTDVDRQKEDEELQMALKLSLQEEEHRKPPRSQTASSSTPGPAAAASSSSRATPGPSGPSGRSPTPQSDSHAPLPSGTTAATVSRVRALFDFVPSEPGELEFKKGDVIAVVESVYKDWWRGSLKGKNGIFPLNYVEKLADPTPGELAREAHMEAEVFAEIKNVEKLLTLLSTNNSAPREEDNEEISKLYHQTLAIRPKLIKLIEKYSQKKDDFTQLNEKFIKARRDYEALLESSMSHPPQPTYHQYAPRPPQMGPGGYGQPAPNPNYPSQPPAQPQDQRYYGPGPGQGPQDQQPQQSQPYPSSPPPNNLQRVGTTPAPFYMAGAEVPPQGNPPATQQYPPRDQTPQVAPLNIGAGKQPEHVHISPHPPAGTYAPYQPPQGQQQLQPGGRPVSTGANNPQELATSAYDSPLAAPQTGDPYSASIYSQDDPFSTAATAPSAGGAPPQQQHYTSYQPPPQQAPPPAPGAPSSPLQQGFDGRASLPSQSEGGTQQQYRPYVPPTNSTDGPGGPADYYRGYGQ